MSLVDLMSENDYQMLFDMAADCMLILDMKGVIVQVNQSGAAQRGYTKQEMVGRHISELAPPEYAVQVPERMKALTRDGQARFESAHICKDGRVMPVEIHSRVIELAGIPHVFSVIRDITDTRASQKIIDQSRLQHDQQNIFLQALLDNAPFGVHMYRSEADGRLIFTGANQSADRILGTANSQFIGQTIEEAFPALLETEVPAQYRKIAHDGGEWSAEQISYSEGLINGAFAVNAFQTLPGQMAVFFSDITSRKQQEQALRESEERWKFALEGSGDGVWDWNPQTDQAVFSKRWKAMIGYAEDEFPDTGAAWVAHLHPDDRERVISTVQNFFVENAPYYEVEFRMRCKDGSWKWMLARGMLVSRDEQGRPLRMIGTHTDLTERKRTEEIIWRQANFDALTGLPNRRMLRDRLDQEIKKAQRSSGTLALLFIDLDRFKEVNDILGHHVGDELLIEASRRLEHCVRESDTIGRLGGDEFTVLVSQLHRMADVQRLANTIIEKLAEPYQLGDEWVTSSASIGIAVYPDDATQSAQLLQYADQAMYAAKGQGGGRFSFFTPLLQEEAQNRMRLTGELSVALASGQFRVYFQPIVELASNRIFKAEALLRWVHPQRGMISPMSFIPLAEETGLIIPIGDWVFRESISWAKRWKDISAEGFQISVNKSPNQFCSGDNADVIWLEFMRNAGLTGRNICIEITEGLLLNRDDTTSRKLFSFRDAGIQVSIDDFGTGYSSLSYLKKFDIDYLKIDQSFVRNMVSDPADLALCEAIVVMAHKLGLKVIAEGVETRSQRDLLIQIGCDFAQGYLFARPMPGEELDALLFSQQSQR
jgi:diguanylate cyclase (GGDEF)-like protein/PAS domain S-box-containing protein